MALTIDPQDSGILDGSLRIKFLRDADYAPAPPLVALFGDEQTLLKCTSDGKLKVDASVSIDSVDIGDVDARGKDATNVSQYLQVLTEPVTGRYALIVDAPSANLRLDEILAALGGGTTQQVHEYDDAASVAAATPTTIVSYVVPVGKTFYLRHATASGSNVATFWIEIDGITQSLKRSYFTEYNVDFFFESPSASGLVATAGQVVRVRGEHARPSAADFEASLSGSLT